MKKWINMILASLLVVSVMSAEEENKRELAGTRALSTQEHVALEEKRLELEESREEEAQDRTSWKKVEVGQDVERAQEEYAKKGLQTRGLYLTSHEGVFHTPVAISLCGDLIELEDGSCWNVSFWDQVKTLKWLTTDWVMIAPNESIFSSYYYQLVNVQTGDKVAVDLMVKPYYNGVFTHWITGIDYFLNEVILDDGSVWSMDIFDRHIVDTWRVNDTLIIGINNCCLSSCPPNILINADTLEYARGTCLN